MKKPRGYRGAPYGWKQWLPVTELDPKFHQVAESRASYFFDQDLYDMILAAPEAEQPRPIERAPAPPTRPGAAGPRSTGSRLQRS